MLEVRPTSIELNDFRQILHATIVHVRTSQFHVTQRWRLEGTINCYSIVRFHHMLRIRVCTTLFLTTVGKWSKQRMSSADTKIFSGRTHTDVVETFVIEGQSASHRHVVNTAVLRQLTANHADSRTRKLRTMVTVDALAFVHEDPEALLRVDRQSIFVALSPRIKRSLVRNQSRFVHHDRKSPEQ